MANARNARGVASVSNTCGVVWRGIFKYHVWCASNTRGLASGSNTCGVASSSTTCGVAWHLQVPRVAGCVQVSLVA